MANEGDYLERAQAFSETLHGKRPTTDELAESFALYGPEKRAAELQRLRDDMDSSRDRSWRRSAELMNFQRKLRNVHSTLSRVKR
jgi:hypothetical protein